MGEGDTSKLNGAGGSWQDNNLKFSQLRFDGWFYVDSAKAGSWAINQKFDDYFAFFIDNANVLYNNGYSGEANSTVAVAEGWHRFTIICGDTYGGYGSNKNFGGDIGSVPFVIAVNGATYAFNTANFTQGSGLNRVALEADADWSDRGDVILASGAVLDLNGHNLTVKDIVCDDYVGAVVTNSASKKSVIYFLGEPTASKGLVDGLIKEVDVKIILAKNGDQVATWTGAVSSDPANANNWEDLAGEPVVPTAAYTVKIVGNNVNLQAPAGTDIACKVFEIGNCTLTTDCDWRGLSVKPTIVGTANLDGHVLKLNNLSAVAGSAFSGGEGSTVEFAPPSEGTTYAKMGESAFIDNIANLTTSGDVKFLLSKDGAGGTLTVTELDLGKMHYAEFVQTNGTVNLGNVWCAIGGKDSAAGHGVYRMTGGTLTAAKDFTVGSKGVGEFIQTSGNVTLNNWFNIGRNGGTGILTIDGGRMVNTFNREVYVGAEGGTGTINVGGNGYLEVHCLPLGAWGTDNTKGYVNISGNGHLKARNWVALCNNNSSRSGMWGEVNQSGGTFEITTDFAIGERSTGTGVYNLTGGDMTVRLMQIGWNTGSVGRMTMSGGTATTSSDFYVGRDGTGTFNLSGGDMTVGGLARISWGSGGVGTMTMDGGTFTVNGNQLLVADWGKGTFTQNAGTVTVTKASAYVGIGQCNGSSGSYVMNGGTVVTPGITGGAGTSTFIANGGTVKVASDNANVLTGVDTVIYATGGLTVDTDGHAATLGGSVVDAWLGSSFVKAGAGTLTAATFPAVDSLIVSNGVFALSASADNTIVSALAHRWSFNDGTLADSVTGSAEGTSSTGELTFEDGMLRLSGGNRGTAYADLGANRLPYESVTLEFWTTIQECVTWQKMFCIGKDSGNVLGFTFNRNNATGPWSLDVAPNGGVYQGTGGMSAQTPYYVVFTFAYDGAGTTVKGSCYNVTTGEKVGSFEQALANWRLTEKITQDKFALGLSFWNDPDAKAAYDEVRVWKGALSDEAIALSLAKGPNATAEDIAAIVAATSTATPVERTLDLAGGTLDLGGNTLTQPNLMGNGGTVRNGTLTITDTIRINVGDSIFASGTVDLTNAKVELVDPDNLTTGFYFIKTAPGAMLSIVGKPEAENLPKGWQISVSSSGAKVTKVGFTIFLK